MIQVWESWYKGNVQKFHSYRIYNGKTHIRCQRLSLGMAKKVSEDIADLLLNEKVGITIANQTTDVFVKQVLKNNGFSVMGSEYQERKASTGTVAYVPYIDGLEVMTETGEPVSGGEIKINYVTANDIRPLSWNNGKIVECAFVFGRTIQNKKYAHIQMHVVESVDNIPQYVIKNTVVECTNGSGRELTPEKWRELKGFQGLAERIETGSSERQFVIDKLNITNNYDKNNPMGVAIFANAIDQLKGIDTVYDSYINEFVLGKKRIFVSPEMLAMDDFGNPAFDSDDVVFYQLPEDSLKDGKAIVEVDMDIRAEAHGKGINDNLNLLSTKCGFGTEHYKFENGDMTTATQVISENSDMYRMIKKHEIILEDVLKELIQIICRLGIVIGASADPDAEVTIKFDDSIIEDAASERKEDRQDVAMGTLQHWEYRSKWRNETEERAKAMVIQEEPAQE